MFLLVARIRGLQLAAMTGVATTALLWLVPGGLVPVPGREGVFALVWPLLPLLAACAVPEVMSRALTPTEIIAPRSWLRRLGTMSGALLVQLSTLLLAAFSHEPTVIIRNYVLYFGLAAIHSGIFEPRSAWAVLVAPTIVVWLLGTDLGGNPKPWALFLLPPESIVAATAALALGVIGLVVCAHPLNLRLALLDR